MFDVNRSCVKITTGPQGVRVGRKRETTTTMKPLAAAALVLAVSSLAVVPATAQIMPGSVPAAATSQPSGSPIPIQSSSPGAISPDAAGSPSIYATIVDSGSTNTTGYTVTVGSDGTTSAHVDSQPGHGTVPAAVAQKFYADLNSAGPLDKLPRGTCMRSASFGTTLVILWRGARSPDLHCPQNDIEQRLANDATAVSQALKITPTAQGRHGIFPIELEP